MIDLIKRLQSRIEDLTDFEIFELSIFESSDFLFSKDCRTRADIIHRMYPARLRHIVLIVIRGRFDVAYCCQSSFDRVACAACMLGDASSIF